MLLGTAEMLDDIERAAVRDGIKARMPGVEVVVVDGVKSTVLRYRPVDPVSDSGVGADIAREALSMVRELLRSFTLKGSIGGIDNVVHSEWLDVDLDVDKVMEMRRRYLALERRLNEERS